MESNRSAQPNFERILGHLQKKWGKTKSCPMCAEQNWGVDEIYQLTLFEGMASDTGRVVLPIVPVICQNCGYTVLISAIRAGFLG